MSIKALLLIVPYLAITYAAPSGCTSTISSYADVSKAVSAKCGTISEFQAYPEDDLADGETDVNAFVSLHKLSCLPAILADP